MEYDNDRPVKRAYKIEILYWILLALVNPLINSVTVFVNHPLIWPILFVVNFFMLPAYVLYSVIIVPKLFIEKKRVIFSFLTILFIILIQALVVALYSLVLHFPLSSFVAAYFTYDLSVMIREFLWCIIYLAMTVGIYFIKKALDEKELLDTLEKDNILFRLKY